MPDPFMDEVHRLAWRTDDPRVLRYLWRENDPARTVREKVIGDTARAAGWPDAGMDRSRLQASAAMRRLEGMDFSIRAQQARKQQRQAAYKSRSRGMVTTARGAVLPVEDGPVEGWAADDGPATIFDE